jgi:CTD small phosphatase-like protein 2
MSENLSKVVQNGPINISSENTKTILNNIKQALTLNEEESNQSSNLETSKVSNDSTLTDSSSLSKESNKMNEYLNSFDYFQFEQNFKKYYVDSSQNNNGNYDYYVKNALKLISLIPFRKLFINEKIKEISKTINFQNLKNESNQNKKLLILDLDETLVHSDLDFLLKEKNVKYDTILHFDSEEEKNIPLPLMIRPGLYKFLDYASENFDLVVFTASDQDYADTIINYIEKDKKYFKMRLYRNNCIFIEPGLYIKDLRIFNSWKNMENIIIVDNSLFSFANQLNNGILITSFFDDKKDTFLYNVKDYLEYIKNEKDIREINKESFRFEEIKEDISRNNNN